MADNTQYILSFNLDETVAQVDSVGRSYTELGATIRGISGQVQDDVESLNQKLSSVNSTLSLLTSSLDLTFSTLGLRLTETSHLLEDIAKHSQTISENFSNLPSTLMAPGAGADKDTVGERTADVLGGAAVGGALVGGADAATEALQGAKAEAEGVVDDVEKQLSSLEKFKGKIADEVKDIQSIVGKELKSAKRGVGSIVSRGSAGVIGGSIIGSAITAMVLGYKEKDRKRAESGEMLNVLEASGEKLFSGPVKKANKWFSQFQERAQFHLGIGRKEIQAAAKQMVDAGFDSTELMEKFNSKLGLVGSNVTTLTLGLDKHLNLASGESMKKVITLTQDYGDSMKDAASNIMNLSLKAQQSGAGISKFIDSVMSGSSALAQYGIDLKEIVNLTSTLEGHYTAMGLDKQYAGQLATTSASGIAQGITGFQTPMKMLMASKMGLGEGYEGLQKLEEGWGRVKEGKKGGFFVDMLNAVRQIQEENVGGSSRSTKIAFWKEQGLSGPSATTFVDIADKGNFDELLDNTKESKETLKGLKKAFQTEGEQLSELQKDQRDIIDGMAAVGRGILQLVSGLIGVIVAGIRSIPALIDYALLKLSPADDDGRADRIMEAITGMMSQQFATIAAGASSLADASVKLKDTVGEKIYKVFGENMRSAVTGDLSGYQAVEKMEIKELKSYIDDNTSLLKTAIQLFGADDMKRSAHEKRITADVSRAYARLDKLERKILLKEEERVQGVTEDPYMGQNVPEGMYEPAVQTLISIEDIEAGLVAGDAKRNPGMGE